MDDMVVVNPRAILVALVLSLSIGRQHVVGFYLPGVAPQDLEKVNILHLLIIVCSGGCASV